MTDRIQTSRRALLKLGVASVLVGPVPLASAAGGIETAIDPESLKVKARTPLGLYLTPEEAHSALLQDSGILFVDVRDPIEISFVGHPEGIDKIIPLSFMTHDVDPDSGQYRMVGNPNVVAEFDALLAAKNKLRDAPIIVTCRSGARSAVVVQLLSRAGYSNVWNVVEGFEGDKDQNGVRAINGWRNAGLPWSYRLKPGVAWSRET